ncbi:MAG TPA: hypothetical protein DCQ92_00875 [Verrucomicrobia subdivision 3 bacterium]|nr:hypothetical protein [Limisphaerales bacterium]
MLLCISTLRAALAGSNKIGTAQRKTPKGDKRSARMGKATKLGRFCEKLPSAGDVKNDTAGL